ncbi:Ferric enterobactin transport ATP-binding protein FepC [Bacteroidales bacterium CF]|jgi:iron complex transport system ATP-binding protein|nr:Ferric enterobactin transport ATP-binding protein FepC [Bacteroidales bacterium CF]
MNFLEIENMSCGYEKKFLVSDIDISIAKGSFVGIIGPNGSGKTTLFRGISGDLKLKSGKISLNNKNLKYFSHKERARNLAIVTQDIESPDITVEDYVLMGRLPYHKGFQFFENEKDIEIAEKYMKLTGVSHMRDKFLSQLSGGERQMVAITKALVQEPELLLLDEPTSHLDIALQIQILNLVQQLNDELGLTVMMIIHDLNLAGEYCDELILMNKGKIKEKGLPEYVLTYSNIEEVYGTVVFTQPNPLSGRPAIFLVSKRILNSINKER